MIIRTFITHNAGISTAASTAPADEWWDRQRQESFVAKTKTYLEPKRDNEKNVNVVWRITNQNSSQTTVHAALVWAEHRKTTFPQRRTFKLQKTAVALGTRSPHVACHVDSDNVYERFARRTALSVSDGTH